MFPITLTIHNPEQLSAVLAALGTPLAAPAAEPKAAKAKPAAAVSAEEKAAVLTADQQAAVDDTAGLGNGQGAATAPTPPTAKAVGGAAPVKTAGASAQSAGSAEAAPQAWTAATEKVEYDTLQAAVLKLHKLDAAAAKPIAEALGYPTFKAMPEDKWPEALSKVNEALAERGVV